MPAELIDVNKEFHLGNSFTLEMANRLALLLNDEYRVVVKYDLQDLPCFVDDKKLNIIISTSRETHDIPNEFFRSEVFAIFQHYFMLDKWGDPMHNPLAYPLPLGPFRELAGAIIKPLSERKYDFSFVGQIPDTGTRDGFKRNLDKLVEQTKDKYKFYIKYTNGFSKGLPPDEYLEILGETKVSLCPSGATSYETFRFFESIIMGAVPLVEQLPKLWYYENAPHFSAPWRDLDGCLSKILNFLQTPQSRNILYGIANYYTEVLSPQGLAEHLKDKIDIRKANINTHKEMLEEFKKQLKNRSLTDCGAGR